MKVSWTTILKGLHVAVWGLHGPSMGDRIVTMGSMFNPEGYLELLGIIISAIRAYTRASKSSQEGLISLDSP